MISPEPLDSDDVCSTVSLTSCSLLGAGSIKKTLSKRLLQSHGTEFAGMQNNAKAKSQLARVLGMLHSRHYLSRAYSSALS